MTEREEDILRTLTHRVRYLSADQLTRGWWKPGRSGTVGMRRTVRSLIARKLLAAQRLPVEPEIDLRQPILTWLPDDPDPEPGPISRLLQNRWTAHASSTTIVFATWTAARLFGGYGGGIKNSLQVTHDLHLSQIYLKLRAADPDAAARWETEDVREHTRHEKVPDVYVRDAEGEVERVIEFGGKYDAARVWKFHAFCADRRYPYELW
ncbi:MAG TPA: hypothetical protein PLJ47_10905 [Candidatus Hydrogenedentes bacterium]|nr:hypothetical protein [Candidatus Hydrogenedentota bacterium]